MHEYDYKCGICPLIDYCGEPYSPVCYCKNDHTEDLTPDETIKGIENGEIWYEADVDDEGTKGVYKNGKLLFTNE